MALNALSKIQGLIPTIQDKDKKNMKFHMKLKDFSPWLADFSSTKLNVNIEVPGQYSGDQKPTPERHIMISRFSDTVCLCKNFIRRVYVSKVQKFTVKSCGFIFYPYLL